MYYMSIKKIQLAGTATVGPKGQVVIPAEVREKMAIKPGDKLIVLYIEEKKYVGFVTEDQAQAIVNKLGENLATLQDAVGRKA
jgi:AbrB family looped-hinge helix DNA binding protein